MDILLNSDILLEYFDGIFQAKKDEKKILISNIINNETNLFILNKEIIEEYEVVLNKMFNNNIDAFYPFLNEILSKKIDVKVEEKKDDCYQNVERNYLSKDQYSKSVIYSNVSINRNNSLNNQYSCIIEDISSQNIHWLISKLACLKDNSFTIRYYDFNSDNEIKALFNNLYTLTNRYTLAYIYDRQINFGHNLFDLIKNTHSVHYYTAYSRRNREDNQDIKDNFRRVKIFKIRRNNIHERKVIIKDLVIEVDNDFWNLRCNEQTWKIDISLSKETADKIMNKNSQFKRCMN